MRTAAAIVLTAMPEEADPFLARARQNHRVGELTTPSTFRAWFLELASPRILLVQSGVGQSAAASALTWAFGQVSTRDVFISGTAGGLHPSIEVGDIIIGSEYRYGMADATAFDYVYGQVPGQPAKFDGSERVLEIAEQLENSRIKTGLMLSSDSFVTAKNVDTVREAFPDALSTDMESTAVAQVCHAFGTQFAAIRAVSDLCGPAADQDFHMALDEAAELAAETTLEIISVLRGGGTPGRRRRQFGLDALYAALFAVIAIDNDLEPVDGETLDLDLSDLSRDLHDEQVGSFAELVAAGKQFVAENPAVRITSQRYDTIRAEILQDLNLVGGRGRQTWPPTSQTIMKRFDGYWNNAMTAIGLTGGSGRRRGGLRYSDQDYREAIRLYHEAMNAERRNPSYSGYQQWLSSQDKPYPSGASIRQHFGTWADAILSLYSEN
ncbi:5'-methylthioadenosine/S-adenosylhomocysteine nucleosidase [Flaviflexus salsibiostraticola]|uniref:adenosylhomocysteine nucleosidase n=1 Tax=Flaviflexus salsibiostraticola TaxID=1282737 RepID=A0A3S8ZA01_9ACTO|nr:5'-methylthioadenosine/S-adenosylhomocysteine nucleosidase [Flaviflexus salsibiostraticola]AZN30276.1 5'-methylthioadenosine/S-adenosylhomocysteine nucleosidase [Flaviflexus salsibiostraticola]